MQRPRWCRNQLPQAWSSPRGRPARAAGPLGARWQLEAETELALVGTAGRPPAERRTRQEPTARLSYWDAVPDGASTGAFALHLRPRDCAKLGQLMLDGGRLVLVVPEKRLVLVQVALPDPGGDDPHGGMLEDLVALTRAALGVSRRAPQTYRGRCAGRSRG